MSKRSFIFLILACSFLSAPLALAHQPRLVDTQTEIRVSDPEISKAYYGALNGTPATYTIQSEKPFSLYINILVPKLPESQTNFSGMLSKNNKPVATIASPSSKWKEFYEEFGEDWYIKGPEWKQTVTAGTYTIKISNPTNQGKYVLAIGEQEAFSTSEIFKSIWNVSRLKLGFFEYSWFAFVWSRAGIIWGGILLLAAGLAGGVVWITKRSLRKKK